MTPHPTSELKIALAQLNPTVGDVARNLAKARTARAEAARQGADIVLFSEMYLSGYQAEDLVFKPAATRSIAWRAIRPMAARRCSWACLMRKQASSTTPMRCCGVARWKPFAS